MSPSKRFNIIEFTFHCKELMKKKAVDSYFSRCDYWIVNHFIRPGIYQIILERSRRDYGTRKIIKTQFKDRFILI